MNRPQLIDMVRSVLETQSKVYVNGYHAGTGSALLLVGLGEPAIPYVVFVTFDRETLQSLTLVGADNVPTVRVQGGKRLPRNAACALELYVNEDGISMRLPRNDRATLLLKALYHPQPLHMAVLLGDVFICGPTDGDGDLTDVPQVVLEAMEMAKPRTEFEKHLPGRFGPGEGLT